jgi:hypothetical protein
VQFEQANEFARHRRCRLADVKDLCGLSEIDRHRCEVEDRWTGEALSGRVGKKIEDFVTVGGVAPDAGAAAAERGQRQFGDACREFGGDDGVDRVATAAQEARSGNRLKPTACMG